MEAARTIRDAVGAVERLRASMRGDPALMEAVHEVKRLQARRFRGTYRDLLEDPHSSAAARFFLEELYGDRDFARRDEQFARIAGAIERLFPAQVAATAASLATLHALTEDLDVQMGRQWAALGGAGHSEARRYAIAWRQVGRAEERERQLAGVLALGQELSRLTRAPGLRTMLRMMRGPATAAGLADLQRFLEQGFDTFAQLSRTPGAAHRFLRAIEEREAALAALLYSQDLVSCETRLAGTLGQAP